MRKLVVIVTAGLAVTAAPPTEAQQGTALCTFSFDNGAVSPGLSISETTSAQWTAGPGPIHCEGSVDGQEITGPGTIREHGTLEGTCAKGRGTAVQVVTLPTANGTVVVENNPVPFSWSGPTGPFSGPRMQGVFQYWPTAGNCLTQPVTSYSQLTQAIITPK